MKKFLSKLNSPITIPVLVILIIIGTWYIEPNDKFSHKVENSMEISLTDKKASQIIENYTTLKQYHYEDTKAYRVTRSKIPFIWDKKLISHGTQYYSRPKSE